MNIVLKCYRYFPLEVDDKVCSGFIKNFKDFFLLYPLSYCTFFFFVLPGIEPRDVLPPRYTPGPIFLYFVLKSGLTKLRRASLSRQRERDRQTEKERERERERERQGGREEERMLARAHAQAEAGHEPRSSGLHLPSTGITSVHLHAQLAHVI